MKHVTRCNRLQTDLRAPLYISGNRLGGGATAGIGHEFAVQLAARGDAVDDAELAEIRAALDGGLSTGALFGVVLMPPEVRREVLPNRGHPDEGTILAAETAGWLRESAPPPIGPELPELDEGEAACIRIALANPGPSLLLMDEQAGRAIATERGLRVADTAAARARPCMRPK